jgi:AcrR family transcriptional regulator
VGEEQEGVDDAALRALVPPSILQAWGKREQATRGPKRGLTLERIVAAGITVALTDGLGSVSMARVAAELGASTMSLYRYVAAKDELLTLMVDAALADAPPGLQPGEDWRDGITRWARAERAAYHRHPWALRVPISGPPLAPNNIHWLESALSCLGETPLHEQQKLSTVLVVTGFVRNEATLAADFAVAAASVPAMPTYGTLLRLVADPARFPALFRAIDAGVLDDEEGMQDEFDFGLARILDGVQVLISAAQPKARPGQRSAGPRGGSRPSAARRGKTRG